MRRTTGHHVTLAARDAAIVLGAPLVLLVVIVVGAASAAGSGEIDLDLAMCLHLAVYVLGLSLFGRVRGQADLGDGTVTLDVAASFAPLVVTAAVVTTAILVARLLHRDAAVEERLRSAALTGICAGVFAGLLAVASRTRDLGGSVPAQVAAEVGRGSLGMEALRLTVTSAVVVAVASLVGHLVRGGALAALGTRWGGAWSRWIDAMRCVGWFLATSYLLVTLVLVIALAMSDEGPGGIGTWLVIVALLPNAVPLLAPVGHGGSLHHVLNASGQLGDSITAEEASSPLGRVGDYGLLHGDADPLTLTLLGTAVVALVVAVIAGGVRQDPRRSAGQDWWRVGLVLAVAELFVVLLTGFSATGAATGSSILGSASGKFSWTAGLSPLSTVLTAFMVGVLICVVQQLLLRPLATVAPRAVATGRRGPGRLHPLWALLLTDAVARSRHEPAADLREQARSATEGDTSGLQPLVSQPRTKRTAAAVVGVLALVVLVPVAYAVLSSTVAGPEAAVRRYAEAMAAGDAGTVRSLNPDARGPLLTDAALSEQRRAAAMRVVSVDVEDGSSDDERAATVVYDVAGDRVTSSFSAQREEGEHTWGVLPRWRVVEAMPTLTVSAPDSLGKARINGVEVSLATGQDYTVYPGRVTVTPEPPAQLTSADWSGTVVGVQGTQVALNVALTDDAVSSARAAVQAFLSACAGQTVADPAGCPLDAGYTYVEPFNIQYTYAPVDDDDIAVELQGGTVYAGARVTGRYDYDYVDNGFFGSGQVEHSGSTTQGSFVGTVTYDSAGATFTSQEGGAPARSGGTTGTSA